MPAPLRVKWLRRRRGSTVERTDRDPGSGLCWQRRRLLSPLLCCLAIQAAWMVLLVHLDRLMLPPAPNLLQDAPARPAMTWR